MPQSLRQFDVGGNASNCRYNRCVRSTLLKPSSECPTQKNPFCLIPVLSLRGRKRVILVPSVLSFAKCERWPELSFTGRIRLCREFDRLAGQPRFDLRPLPSLKWITAKQPAEQNA